MLTESPMTMCTSATTGKGIFAMSTRTAPASLTHRLDAEWRHLVSSPATAQALVRWSRLEPAIESLSDLEQLRATVHDRTNIERGDSILAALVRLGAVSGHGDLLAARVVLQLLVPGAIRLAQSLAPMVGDQATSEAVVFAELTILIRTYPWERRPRRIAANLLLDCRQRLVRSHDRTRPEISAGLSLYDANAATDGDNRSALPDVLWWAHRRGILSRFETQLLFASHVADIPMNQLVSRFGRSRSTLFTIRASAEARLRQALTANPAAAGGDGSAAVSGDGAPPISAPPAPAVPTAGVRGGNRVASATRTVVPRPRRPLEPMRQPSTRAA
jgi:hypothetical protein